MIDEDIQWIDASLAGDSAAFGHLVRKYQDRLYSSLLHILGSAEDAADVAQEVFVQAYTKLGSFQRQSAFYTWLYRIGFNTAVSRRRRARPMLSVEQCREEAGLEPTDHREAPSAQLEQQERVAMVQTGLAALSDEHRQILVMKEVDGLRYEEIAEILDIPIGTVRSRLFRARLQLKEILKEVVEEDYST